MEVDLDKMADRVAEKALDEFTYNGKTIREWVELMVTVESVVEVRMVEELEKIKADLEKLSKNEWNKQVGADKGLELAIDVVEDRISELKGENE